MCTSNEMFLTRDYSHIISRCYDRPEANRATAFRFCYGPHVPHRGCASPTARRLQPYAGNVSPDDCVSRFFSCVSGAHKGRAGAHARGARKPRCEYCLNTKAYKKIKGRACAESLDIDLSDVIVSGPLVPNKKALVAGCRSSGESYRSRRVMSAAFCLPVPLSRRVEIASPDELKHDEQENRRQNRVSRQAWSLRPVPGKGFLRRGLCRSRQGHTQP